MARAQEIVERLSSSKSRGSTALVSWLLNRHKRGQEEIHDILANATAAELNYMLSFCNCGKLAYVASKDTFCYLLGNAAGWRASGARLEDLSLVSPTRPKSFHILFRPQHFQHRSVLPSLIVIVVVRLALLVSSLSLGRR